MTCGECPKGKTERVVGNGITEPPYVWLVRCPFESEYYKYPDDECCHEAGLKAALNGGHDGIS